MRSNKAITDSAPSRRAPARVHFLSSIEGSPNRTTKNRLPTGFPSRTTRVLLPASVILMAQLGFAQDALRYSMAGDVAAQQQKVAQENLPYTFKSGDFRLLVTPSLELDWNDNVNISEHNAQSDEILKPMLRLDGSYPISDRNLLSIDVGIGYDYYFEHPHYSGLRAQSGSQVAFDVFVGDFKIDFHDRFSFEQDPAGYAALYGTAEFDNLQNLAGLSVDWDLQDLVLTLGYDHLNYLLLSGSYNYVDNAAEMFVLRPGFQLNPALTVGLEGTLSYTHYDQAILNDYINYSGGVYADWHPDPAFSIRPRAGYTLYSYYQTSPFLLAQDQTTWYADVTLQHAITKAITYSLAAGHEVQPGFQAENIQDWYVRPNVSWGIFKNFAVNTSISYEHGKQSAQGFGGAASEVFDWFGGGLSLAFTVVQNLKASLNYRFTIRGSSNANQSYTQNLVGLQLTYAPR